MTTEIAVSNKLGIALATDSAVTISGNGHTKVFQTADKLFELSPNYPVAFMINGNMDYLGVPWELLAKEFRSKEGGSDRQTVEKWADDLIHFIGKHELIKETDKLSYITRIIDIEIELLQGYVGSIFRKKLFESVGGKKKPTVRDIKEIISEYISLRKSDILLSEKSPSLEEFSEEKILSEYGSEIERICKDKFQGRQLSDSELAAFKSLVFESITRFELPGTTTGIVVAGFGAEESFPSVCSVEIDGFVVDRIKVSSKQLKQIENCDDGGQVICFAQADVFQRVLGGADPRFIDKTADFIFSAVKKVAESIENSLRSKVISKKNLDKRQKAVDEVAMAIRDEYLVTREERPSY